MAISDTFLTAFILYLVVVVIIALVAWRVTVNLSDFVLGGRRLNGPVAALSAGASDMSAWLLLGLPGAAFSFGLNQIWLPIGLILGAYLNWLFVARPLRVYTERANDALTIPAFLDARLSNNSRAIRVVSALATLVFFAVYTASGLVGGALLMAQSFGLDFTTALLAGTAIIVSYTFVGGFLAVSWTDFFQGNFMFLCLMAVPIMVISGHGGFESTLMAIEHFRPEALQVFQGLSLLGVINLLAWGLGYFGQPHILVRFMAVRTENDIKIARRVSMTWMILSLAGALLTGFVGIAYFQGVISNPEAVFITFAQALFSPAVSGMVLAAILSSIMCAIDSQMLASTSALTEDVYHPIFRPKASQKELVWVGRIALILIAVIAVFLALRSGKGVLDLVSFAWAGLASTFGAPVVLSLFWRGLTANGALAGMILGGSAAIVWSLYISAIVPMYEIIPGIFISTFACIVFSSVGNQPSAEQLALFDSVHKHLES